MKKVFFLIALMFSFASFAETAASVWPHVYNYGHAAQVQVWNHTDRAVRCSGWVYMTMESGERESQHYYDFVSPRFSSYRMVYPRFTNSRISHVSHSIWCN